MPYFSKPPLPNFADTQTRSNLFPMVPLFRCAWWGYTAVLRENAKTRVVLYERGERTTRTSIQNFHILHSKMFQTIRSVL
jgi:hypothetical protein